MTEQRDYDLWHSMLAGSPIKVPAHVVGLGFYRKQERDGRQIGVAIWANDAGRPIAKVGSYGPKLLGTHEQEEDFSFNTFAWCKAVSEDAYRAWAATGTWPDQAPAPAATNNANAADDVQLRETVAELKAEAEAWLKSIGGKVENQDQANKAADFADRFAEIEKDAETRRKAENDPLAKQVKEINARWKPISDAGAQAKTWAKNLTLEWQRAEKVRLLKEAAAAAEAGEVVRTDKLKPKTGTRGRAVTLRTRQEYRCTDYAAQFEHWKDKPEFREHLLVVQACGQLSKAALEANLEVPGAKLETVESVA